MKQITVKRPVEALYWLHNNEHHIVGTEWPRKLHEREQNMENRSHIFFANHFEKIRVPISMAPEVFKHIRANKRKFDTRMYALTKAGRIMVS